MTLTTFNDTFCNDRDLVRDEGSLLGECSKSTFFCSGAAHFSVVIHILLVLLDTLLVYMLVVSSIGHNAFIVHQVGGRIRHRMESCGGCSTKIEFWTITGGLEALGDLGAKPMEPHQDEAAIQYEKQHLKAHSSGNTGTPVKTESIVP
ncbi:hypothetical protein TruAng_012233 [Truncatella angustata]|nr:hypothetical protein TruAng_012233 [Truncatella angustata]